MRREEWMALYRKELQLLRTPVVVLLVSTGILITINMLRYFFVLPGIVRVVTQPIGYLYLPNGFGLLGVILFLYSAIREDIQHTRIQMLSLPTHASRPLLAKWSAVMTMLVIIQLMFSIIVFLMTMLHGIIELYVPAITLNVNIRYDFFYSILWAVRSVNGAFVTTALVLLGYSVATCNRRYPILTAIISVALTVFLIGFLITIIRHGLVSPHHPVKMSIVTHIVFILCAGLIMNSSMNIYRDYGEV